MKVTCTSVQMIRYNDKESICAYTFDVVSTETPADLGDVLIYGTIKIYGKQDQYGAGKDYELKTAIG